MKNSKKIVITSLFLAIIGTIIALSSLSSSIEYQEKDLWNIKFNDSYNVKIDNINSLNDELIKQGNIEINETSLNINNIEFINIGDRIIYELELINKGITSGKVLDIIYDKIDNIEINIYNRDTRKIIKKDDIIKQNEIIKIDIEIINKEEKNIKFDIKDLEIKLIEK